MRYFENRLPLGTVTSLCSVISSRSFEEGVEPACELSIAGEPSPSTGKLAVAELRAAVVSQFRELFGFGCTPQTVIYGRSSPTHPVSSARVHSILKASGASM
jgi:hypothetical protein